MHRLQLDGGVYSALVHENIKMGGVVVIVKQSVS